jgi:hypothetical protein
MPTLNFPFSSQIGFFTVEIERAELEMALPYSNLVRNGPFSGPRQNYTFGKSEFPNFPFLVCQSTFWSEIDLFRVEPQITLFKRPLIEGLRG